MDTTLLAHSLLHAFTFVIPCFSIVILIIRWAARRILSISWFQSGAHILWPTGISDAEQTPPANSEGVMSSYRRRRVRRYKATAAEVVQVTKCCFCLCDMKDGDEFRELKCNHVFHRICLDTWVEHGRAECPMCRESLMATSSESPVLLRVLRVAFTVGFHSIYGGNSR